MYYAPAYYAPASQAMHHGHVQFPCLIGDRICWMNTDWLAPLLLHGPSLALGDRLCQGTGYVKLLCQGVANDLSIVALLTNCTAWGYNGCTNKSGGPRIIARCGSCGSEEFILDHPEGSGRAIPCYQCRTPVCIRCMMDTNSGVRHWRCPPREQWKRRLLGEQPYQT